MSNPERSRRLLQQALDWWEEDRSRLRVIRSLAYGLFAASVGGTIYSGIRGALPVWAITLYILFVVQLVFLTFMYAIRHSGREEIRRALFDTRKERLPQWKFERELLVEFTRVGACIAAGIKPTVPAALGRASRNTHVKPPIPAVNREELARSLLRESVEQHLTSSSGGDQVEAESEKIRLWFIAYSVETLIELSRVMVAELESIVTEHEGHLDLEFDVRVLIRDTSLEHDWLVPLARDERADREYAADLRTRFRNVQRSQLKAFEETLKTVLSARQVHFAVRGYLVEPLIKGLLVDEAEGFMGLYTVSDLKDPDGWDYSGHGMDFCRASLAGNPVEKGMAEFMRKWFELLWEERNSRSIER